MSLNIKQPGAHELAAKLAALTGESMTTAVVRSIKERLEREEKARGNKRSAERIMAFARRFSEGMPKEFKSVDHAELLYDEHGLPK
jgi:antitoxin VapB